MANLKTTFQEFIQWIPTCQKDLSLESLVSKMLESANGMVALIDCDLMPQGVIYSSQLLNAIAEGSLKLANSSDCRDLWQEIVVPLTIFSSQMKIEDFLARVPLQNQPHEQNYFIVDGEAKLLGILDIPKLLPALLLAQNKRRTQTTSLLSQKPIPYKQDNSSQIDCLSPLNNSRSKLSLSDNSTQKAANIRAAKNTNLAPKNQTEFKEKYHNLYSLLTQISLPLRIENAGGEIFYQNAYWSKEIKSRQGSTHSAVTNGTSVRSWLSSNHNIRQKESLYRKQQGVLEEARSSNLAMKISAPSMRTQRAMKSEGSFREDKIKNNHCPTVNNLSIVSSSSQEIQQQVNQLNLSLFGENVEQSSRTSILTPDVKNCDSEWYYYRLPLALESDFTNEVVTSPDYWLVLGTKLPLQSDLTADGYYCQHNQSKLKQLQNEFILNLSHDIKSPLTAIIGLSSLLKEEKLGSLNTSQRRHSSMIYHSGKRSIDLINDFLDITRLTAGKLQLNLESIDLEITCRQIYDRVKQKLTAVSSVKEDEQKLFPELQLDVDPDAQIAIADKAYFCQILTRLLENALQLTTAEQLLGIAAECWSDWLAITVWNEGGGLSEAQQNFSAREFSDYQNFLTSQEKKQELGLALAQQLAQAHGGDISLISQMNYGSEFTLLLPLKPQELPDDSIVTIDTFEEKTETKKLILIVETSATKIVDLSERLRNLGYYSAIARNSAEALYKAQCFQPWKIVLSSSLVATSELDIIQILKSDPQICQIPLVITADSNCARQNLAEFEDRNYSFSDRPSLSLNSRDENSLNEVVKDSLSFPLAQAELTKIFPSIKPQKPEKKKNLTVLRLSLTEEIERPTSNFALDFVFENLSFSLSHHIIEADSLDQADLLTRIWNIDVIIWDSTTLESPETYLLSFAESNLLANIPIITLDTKSTEAANQIKNLSVFPCLLPANERSISQLTQVIQIAAGFQ